MDNSKDAGEERGITEHNQTMKIIKMNNCRECPHSLKTFCMKVIVPPKYKMGLPHPKRFKRLERGKNYTGFPEWCPLEEIKYDN